MIGPQPQPAKIPVFWAKSKPHPQDAM